MLLLNSNYLSYLKNILNMHNYVISQINEDLELSINIIIAEKL